MSANHEGFLDLHPGTITSLQKRYRLWHRQADWFFTEDMFSSLGGLDRPRHVQMIGKRIVNGLDFWISQKFLIGSESFTDSQLFWSLLGPFEIPRSNRRYITPLTALHRRENLLNGNIGDTQHSPCNFFAHVLL